MRIELMEDDSISQPDGKPKHIYLSIDNKKMILPTDKTILDLLELGKGISPIAPLETPETAQQPPLLSSTKPNEIEREDLVTCIKVLPRGEGANVDIVEGGIYRVIAIQRAGTVVKYFEVIDDAAPIQRRIPVYPQEVVLLKKHPYFPPPIHKFEEIHPCGYCGESNALVLDIEKNKYVGECKKCHKQLETERPVAKPAA